MEMVVVILALHLGAAQMVPVRINFLKKGGPQPLIMVPLVVKMVHQPVVTIGVVIMTITILTRLAQPVTISIMGMVVVLVLMRALQLVGALTHLTHMVMMMEGTINQGGIMVVVEAMVIMGMAQMTFLIIIHHTLGITVLMGVTKGNKFMGHVFKG